MIDMPKEQKKESTHQTQVTEKSQKKNLGNPHDQFFKVIYSSPENALDIFKIILPKDFYNQCNWNTLKAEKRDWIGKQADLIFSVSLKKNSKSKIKIVILLEHKSYYNKDLFKQILDYQNSIYQEDKSRDVLAALPILFYHGEKSYHWKTSFKEGYFGKDLSKIPVFVRENMINYNLIVFDTNNPKISRFFKDKKIKTRGALSALQNIWSLKKSVPEILELFALFSGFPEKQKKNLLIGLSNYLNKARGISFDLLKKVEKRAIKEGILKKGGYMNFTEEIKKEAKLEGWQKGQKEGWQKGQKEGWQKGRQEERQQFVLKMLQKKTDIAFISEVTGLSEREIKKLKNGA